MKKTCLALALMALHAATQAQAGSDKETAAHARATAALLPGNVYNHALAGPISDPATETISLNVSALLQEIAADPQAYGVTPVATGEEHHKLLAEYAQSVVSAPSQVAMLASSANTAGQMQMQHIDRRLQTLSASQDSELAVWFQGEAITGSRNSANARPEGIQTAWKLGVDQPLDAWTLGAYLSYENLDGDTDEEGTYSQKRQSAGLYGRWQSEKFWVNAQLFYSDLDNKTRRHLYLGTAAREHQAKAGGEQYGGKISTGYDWQTGSVTHGPLLSLSMQQSRIKPLSEDDPNLSTTMSFDAQSQRSVQSSVGYQINVAISPQWSLYTSAEWLHEFRKPAELLGARLQDGPYSKRHLYLLTDQEEARDAGLLEWGVTGQLSHHWTLGAGISVQLAPGTRPQTAMYLNTAYLF